MPSRSLAITAITLFAASLLLPAFICPLDSMMGYQVLAIGWAGLLALDPRWFANLGFVALVVRCFAAPKKLPLVGGSTALLALFSIAPAAGCPAPGGAPAVSSGLAIGGWLWVAAMLSACGANLFSSAAKRPSSA